MTLVADSLDLEEAIVGVLKAGCDLDTEDGRIEFIRRHLSDPERELATWHASGVTVYEMAFWLRVNERTVRRRIVQLELKLSDYGLHITVLEGPPIRKIPSFNPLWNPPRGRWMSGTRDRTHPMAYAQ